MSLVAAAALGVSSLLVPAASADPEPSIDDVQRRVDALHHQAEQASERYNTIRARMGSARKQLGALRDRAARQAEETEQLHGQVEQLVLAQVSGAGLGGTADLILSDDADDFLASMSAMRSYSEQAAGLLDTYEDAERTLAAREQRSQDQLDRIVAAKEQMAREQTEIENKADAAEELLGELEAEARAEARAQARADERAAARAAETTSRSGARPPVPEATDSPSAAPASGAAAVAVRTALAQVGDAYVYGAAGPDSFDCSGLTMYAYAAAGVSLSHSSSIQAGEGTAVSASDVQPGDLVFYYSPISHVGMYIGNGQIVHAANPSSPVEVVAMDLMPVASIRRVA
jgi:cell wall-associated NlpC family hydrolase